MTVGTAIPVVAVLLIGIGSSLFRIHESQLVVGLFRPDITSRRFEPHRIFDGIGLVLMEFILVALRSFLAQVDEGNAYRVEGLFKPSGGNVRSKQTNNKLTFMDAKEAASYTYKKNCDDWDSGAYIHWYLERNSVSWNDMRVKESSQAVEVSLKKMVVSFDKYRGALTFYDANKRLILKESQKEARYVDIKKEPVVTYTFFEGDTSDPYYIYSSKDESLNFIKQKARQISDGEHIPCVIKKDKYAIIPLTLSKAGFSHIPVIGTFIMQEDSFSDYYLIVEDDTEKLKSIYGKLVSKP